MFIASIELTGLLGDVVFLLGIAAFFAVCVGLVKFCDRIVGPDADMGTETSTAPADAVDDETGVAA